MTHRQPDSYVGFMAAPDICACVIKAKKLQTLSSRDATDFLQWKLETKINFLFLKIPFAPTASNDCFIHGSEEVIFYTHCIDLLYWIQSVIMIG